MKKNFLTWILLIISLTSFSQAGMWTWVKGNTAPVFGTKGVADPLNNPVAVYEGCEWTDLNGNFWLFGSSWDETNTLWKYDPVTNNWTWMSGSGVNNDPGNYGVMGVPSPLNQPRGRGFGCLSWVDMNNNLWMYGGSTDPSTNNHDLWKYDISTNEWTWMNGSQALFVPASYGTMGVADPTNFPGGRYESNATWSDSSGFLWLFGSAFFDQNGSLHARNDTWKYNTNTNEWTWMHGPNGFDDPGNYGTLGVSSPSNVPPARACYSKFKSTDGGYYIFGGTTFMGGTFNDLWRYDRSTNEWTWVSGSQNTFGTGVYGIVCEMDSTNIPGNRQEDRVCWSDNDGNFWLFGGNANGDMNDLWKYCPSQNKWSFIKGSTFSNAPVSYGTINVPSFTNDPGARNGSHSWYDGVDKLYLFSGSSQPNDLWTFQIDDSCAVCLPAFPVAIFTAPNDICPGTCTDFTNLSLSGTSFLWSFPGANPAVSTDANPTNICYNTPGNYAVTLIASNAVGSDTITLNNYITVYPFPPAQGIQQIGDTLFANQGGITYQWYSNGNIIPGATEYYYVAPESGNYNVVATDENGCEVEAVIFDVIAGISHFAVGNSQLAIFPNPVRDNLEIKNLIAGLNLTIIIYNNLGEKILEKNEKNVSEKLSVDVSSISAGTYFLELSDGKTSTRKIFTKR